jgi:hypothetical protein
MADDMSNLINNVKNMIDSGNIPDNIKEMLNNFNSSTEISENSKTPNMENLNIDFNNLLNTINASNPTNKSNNSNNFNIDMDTVLKMKNIIEAMNNKDDPRANLLNSLKPYLRESRQGKLDQYINLLNMTKIADFIKKENDNNA